MGRIADAAKARGGLLALAAMMSYMLAAVMHAAFAVAALLFSLPVPFDRRGFGGDELQAIAAATVSAVCVTAAITSSQTWRRVSAIGVTSFATVRIMWAIGAYGAGSSAYGAGTTLVLTAQWLTLAAHVIMMTALTETAEHV